MVWEACCGTVWVACCGLIGRLWLAFDAAWEASGCNFELHVAYNEKLA